MKRTKEKIGPKTILQHIYHIFIYSRMVDSLLLSLHLFVIHIISKIEFETSMH